MKCWFDEKARERKFMPEDRVLALLPIPGKPLQARYYDPNTVDKKINDVNYIVNTPGRRKQKQLCHDNMFKQYIDRFIVDGYASLINSLFTLHSNHF